jgi:hypothetical protein
VTSTLPGAVQIDLNYCTPTYTVGTSWANYTNNDYVNTVNLSGYGGTLINTSTNNPTLQIPSCGGLCNFVSHPPDYEYRNPSVAQQSVTVQQGASYSITVQVGTWFSNNNISAWIDYNHNGLFEASEKLGTASLSALGTATWPFTVPAGPGYTGNTRLRVREVFAVTNPDPCAQYTYGECEDFVVTIIPNCSSLYKLWLGNTNDWNNPANWCPSVPTINDDVMINKTLAAPSGTYYNPVIKNGVNAVCKNITIAVTDTLSIDAPATTWSSAPNFKVKGSVTNNGQIKVITSYTPSITVASGTLLNKLQTPLPGKTYKAAQVQIIYTKAELLGYGMIAGDQISAIKLDVKNPDASIRTYNSFSISYLNSAAVPNAFASTVPITGAFTNFYTNAAQPIVFGTNTFTGIPITWDGVNPIVIQYCYTNIAASPSPDNDYINCTQTTGRKSTLVLGRLPSSVAVAPAPGSFVGQVSGDITASGAPYNAANTATLIMEFRPNATFVLNRQYGKPKIVVQGSWINNNSFLGGSSSFIMDSYKTNRVGGTNSSTFYTFTMNKVTANTATVTAANGLGVSITYSAAGHTYSVGQLVEVTGLTPTGYNASGTITSIVAGVSFTIAGTQTGVSSGTGVASVETATASNARPIILDQDVTVQDTFYLTAGQMIMNGKSLTMTDSRPSAFYRLQVPVPGGSPTYTGTGFLISENPNSLVRWAIGNYTTSVQRMVPFGHRVDTAAAAITFIPFSFLHTAGQLDTMKIATKFWSANVLPDPPTVTHIDPYNTAGSNAANTADRYWMIGKVGPQKPAANFPIVNFVMRYNNSTVLPLVTERPSGVVPAAPTTAKAQPWMAGRLAWLRISANATLGTFTIPIGGVSANGTTITYTTSAAHTIVVGQGVTMTGIAPAGYNIVGGTVIAVTANTFTIANPTSLGASTLAGTVAVAPSGGVATAYNLQQTTLSYAQGLGALGAFDSVRVNNWDWPIVPASGLPYNNPAGPIGDLIPWTITNNSVPLPIELVEFKAKAEGKRVRLDWTTASEIDNDYFTVERSTDVKEYSYIDRVSSYLHNSNIMLNYTTYDEHPLYGLQYYRLKQTDFNGEYTYSEPRAVWFGSRAPFDITNVYGEASTSNNINVDFMYNSNEPVTVIITDAAGRLLFKEDNVAATKGENSIKLNSSLPHGLYFISLKNSDDVVSRKFVY